MKIKKKSVSLFEIMKYYNAMDLMQSYLVSYEILLSQFDCKCFYLGIRMGSIWVLKKNPFPSTFHVLFAKLEPNPIGKSILT